MTTSQYNLDAVSFIMEKFTDNLVALKEERVRKNAPWDGRFVDGVAWYAEILMYGDYTLMHDDSISDEAKQIAAEEVFLEAHATLYLLDTELPDAVNRQFVRACIRTCKDLSLSGFQLPGMRLIVHYNRLCREVEDMRKERVVRSKVREAVAQNDAAILPFNMRRFYRLNKPKVITQPQLATITILQQYREQKAV